MKLEGFATAVKRATMWAPDEEQNNIKIRLNNLNRLCPEFRDVVKRHPHASVKVLRKCLNKKIYKYLKNPTEYPELDTFLLFELFSILIETIGPKRAVFLKLFGFMADILGTCLIQSKSDIIKCLVVCEGMIEIINLSRRLLPINCIENILTACNGIILLGNSEENVEYSLQFRQNLPFLRCLVIGPPEVIAPMMYQVLHTSLIDLMSVGMSTKFKIHTVITAINILNLLHDDSQHKRNYLVSIDKLRPVFNSIVHLLNGIYFRYYPDNLKNYILQVRNKFQILQNNRLGTVMTYCTCGRDNDELMIVCDKPFCSIKWYHALCEGYYAENIPEGEWYCSCCVARDDAPVIPAVQDDLELGRPRLCRNLPRRFVLRQNRQ